MLRRLESIGGWELDYKDLEVGNGFQPPNRASQAAMHSEVF